MNNIPFLPLYVSDYLSDANVVELTPIEEFTYLRLLMFCWRENGLPRNLKVLRELCKGKTPSRRLMKLVIPHPEKRGFFTHKRLLHERQAYVQKCEVNRENAKKAVLAREAKHLAPANGRPTVHPAVDRSLTERSPNQNQNQNQKEEEIRTHALGTAHVRAHPPSPDRDDPIFAKFCEDYPRRIRLKEAKRVWRSLSQSQQLQAVESLAAFKISEQWQECGGKFIPSPDRFLAEKRFEQIPPAAGRQKGKPDARGKSFDPVALAAACGFTKS